MNWFKVRHGWFSTFCFVFSHSPSNLIYPYSLWKSEFKKVKIYVNHPRRPSWKTKWPPNRVKNRDCGKFCTALDTWWILTNEICEDSLRNYLRNNREVFFQIALRFFLMTIWNFVTKISCFFLIWTPQIFVSEKKSQNVSSCTNNGVSCATFPAFSFFQTFYFWVNGLQSSAFRRKCIHFGYIKLLSFS